MRIIDISDELFRELGSPSDVSIVAINFWLRAHIGDLNTLIHAAYELDSNNEFTPEIGESEKAIFKQMYRVYYYGKQVLRFLGAAGLETVIEVESDGARVKRVNKTELSKTFLQAKSAEEKDLDTLVDLYKRNGASPRQVAGDDTIDGANQPYRDTTLRRIY